MYEVGLIFHKVFNFTTELDEEEYGKFVASGELPDDVWEKADKIDNTKPIELLEYRDYKGGESCVE